MKILFAVTYYRPHVSGLTIYVQRLAEAMAARGHLVTVLTSQYDSGLPLREGLNGVRIVRVPVAFSVSKGAIMPSYAKVAADLLRQHDVVAGNLPSTPIEALLLPILARFVVRRPITMTYHCDVQLPAGLFNRVVDEVVFMSNLGAATLADRLVAYTDDYANHSRLLHRFPRKRTVIPPPVDIPMATPAQVNAFRRRFDLAGKTVVGFVARFATEKGVEYVLEAIPPLLAELPHLKILFAGEYLKVIGEDAYRARLRPLLEQYSQHWQFTGVLDPTDPAELASFYRACDVTILPSINSTESFGLVQVESMLSGTPVVASNLPGVRQAVTVTQMGKIVPVADADALAEAILEVVRHREQYVRPRELIRSSYSIERTAVGYEHLFQQLVDEPGPGRSAAGALPKALASTVTRRAGLRSELLPTPRSRPGPPRAEDGRLPPTRRDYLADHLREVPAFRALLRGVECRLFEAAGQLEPPVLDVGCGDGHFASMAFDEPLFAGIDLSEAAVREARGRRVYRWPIVADATRLPFADASFPTVISNSSVEHIPVVEAVIAETARVIRPGGRFIFCVPSHKFADFLLGSTVFRTLGLARLGKAYGDWFNRHSRHYTTDSHEQWRARLDRHGFDLEHWEYYMSPRGHRAFDLAHYLGVPRLISRKLTGKWLAFPNPVANSLFAAWLRPYYQEGPQPVGPYIFFHARRRRAQARLRPRPEYAREAEVG